MDRSAKAAASSRIEMPRRIAWPDPVAEKLRDARCRGEPASHPAIESLCRDVLRIMLRRRMH